MSTQNIETALYKGKVKIKFFPESHQYWVSIRGEKAVRKTGTTTYLGIKDKSVALVSWATELARDFLIEKLGVGDITEQIIRDACSLHNVRKEEAANIGTIIHDWCEKYIKHKLKDPAYKEFPEIPENESAVIGVNAFLDWEKKHKVKFISSERVVYSLKHDFIGTMDIEAIIDGKLCLVDLKSSNGLYNTVRAQTASYAMADMEENPGKKYKGRWAIRLAKETEKEYKARMEKKGKTDYPSYKVFEARDLEEEGYFMERDFDAFLHCVELFRWDKETDFYWEDRRKLESGAPKKRQTKK